MHCPRQLRPSLATALLAALCAAASSLPARAHPPLDASGCYTKLKTGEYLCPRKPTAVAAPLPGYNPVPNPANQVVKQTLQKPLAGGCFVGPMGRTFTVNRAGQRIYGKC